MIKVYSPEECMTFCTPCFGGWDLKFKDITISGVYINEDQSLVTKEMTENILAKIDKFFPLHWANTDILCLPFRPMLKDKRGQWTGTDYNGQAWKGVIALGAQRDIATHLFASSMILHELWHEFAYQFVDSTPFDGRDTHEYRKFKEIMGIQDFKENDIIWEDRPSEILAELGRYYAEDKDFTWDKFITFGDKNDPLPLREAYDYLMSLMPQTSKEEFVMLPVKPGRITQEYGRKNTSYVKGYHTGLDFVASEAEKYIYSVGPGTVIAARYVSGNKGADPNGWGNYVIVRQSDGHDVIYAHLSQVMVKEGAKVMQGASLGVQGNTGNSTGAHLHFEVRKQPWNERNDVNAAEYLDIINEVGLINKVQKEVMDAVSLKGEDFDADAKIVFRGKEIRAGIVTLPEGGKTFVQLTDICDLLGLKYTYDNATKTVTILG